MYKHILIATDGSELATKGVIQGLLLGKTLQAKISAVTVTELWTMAFGGEDDVTFSMKEYQESCDLSAKKILAVVVEEAKKLGVTCEIMHAKNQHPGEGIIKAATEHDCDLIVMSSHGRRGMTGMLLGSQTTNVLTHTTIPVLVIR